jgi:rod shape-determining protein MreD
MSYLQLLIAVYFAAVLQTSLAPVFEVRHVVPDLFALVAIVWQLSTVRPRGFVAASLVGLACDLTSAGPLGIGVGLFALIGFLVGWLREKIDANHLLAQLVVVWLATTAIAAGEVVIRRLLGETTLTWTTLAVRAASVGVYTTGVALPLLMVIGWLREGRLTRVRQDSAMS